MTGTSKMLACRQCGNGFSHSGRGRTPRYCSAGCVAASKRAAKRDQYARTSVREALLREVEAGYWSRGPEADPGAPSAFLGLSVREAVVDESGMAWTISRTDAGFRPPRSVADDWAETADPEYPMGKSWADDGAALDIELIRRKDRERFGGLVGAWSWPSPAREPGWIPVDEWLASLPDDGRAWVNGIGVDPGMMF